MEFHGLKAPLPLHIAGLLIEGPPPRESGASLSSSAWGPAPTCNTTAWNR
jgi:hypothetical protein